MSEVDQVLGFWFAGDAAAQGTRWWRGGDPLDMEIRSRFGGLVDRASSGRLDTWKDEPRSCLALILSLDQFPRSIFRGTPEAFARDAAARSACHHCLDLGLDEKLQPLERLFAYMPLQHSEDVADHERGLPLYERLVAEFALPAGFAASARQHAGIVLEFGRFPHRNKILGREPRQAELNWLAAGGATFGQA